MHNAHEQQIVVPWKQYLTLTAETLLSFYLATFSLAVFIVHRGQSSWFLIGLMISLYLIVIGVCGKLLLNRLSLAALMLVIPIAPLIALIIVISLIPILQYL